MKPFFLYPAAALLLAGCVATPPGQAISSLTDRALDRAVRACDTLEAAEATGTADIIADDVAQAEAALAGFRAGRETVCPKLRAALLLRVLVFGATAPTPTP